MKKVALKPCPFCGGQAKRQGHQYQGKLLGCTEITPLHVYPHYEQLHWYIVKCSKCGVSQPRKKYTTREESDEAWNNRA